LVVPTSFEYHNGLYRYSVYAVVRCQPL